MAISSDDKYVVLGNECGEIAMMNFDTQQYSFFQAHKVG